MDGRGGANRNGSYSAPAKILVIDGDDDHCRLYKEELEDDGYHVVTATTLLQGMDLFRREAPHLVTVDVCLTDSDERSNLLWQMKDISPKVPIILLTACDYRDDFNAWGVDAYVMKSSDLSELKSVIRSATDGKNGL
jgi:DNA-binding response OmpR family regulator